MPDLASQEFSTQWTTPADAFSILLILGGDVIMLAIAALSSSAPITPIAFSFGWAAYAVSALVSAIGDNRLIRCAPEVGLMVFNLHVGYPRQNRSWLLARLLKNYEWWMPEEVYAVSVSPQPAPPSQSAADLLEPGRAGVASPASVSLFRSILRPTPKRHQGGLCVAIYEWIPNSKPGYAKPDWVWWSGIVVTIVQLVVAAIPWILHGNWAVFLATSIGTLLAYTSASLPQLTKEKFQTRLAKKSVALTGGNGERHVIIIEGANHGLDLEALAAGRVDALNSTRVWTVVLAVAWIALLISCTGIRSYTWYLLAVGGLGMLHNLTVAGIPRRPEALGLPIQLARRPAGSSGQANGEDKVPEVFVEEKVMFTLMELEAVHPGYGRALLKEFFPNDLLEWEDNWWNSEDKDERRRLLAAGRDKWEAKKAKRQAHGVLST